MKWLHTNDGEYYRRWVNVLPSILLPGSAQFLVGRKIAGITWFLTSLTVALAVLAFLLHPNSRFSVISMGPFKWATLSFTVAVAVDGLRHPIRPLQLKGWFILICLSLCIPLVPVLGVRAFLVQPFEVPTDAMRPTIRGNQKAVEGHGEIPGDHIFVNKLIYRFSKPQRGDVVAFRTEGLKILDQHTYYLKRVVGLPG